MKRYLGVMVFLMVMLSNLSVVEALDGKVNANFTGSWIIMFLPVFGGIIYLALKGENN